MAAAVRCRTSGEERWASVLMDPLRGRKGPMRTFRAGCEAASHLQTLAEAQKQAAGSGGRTGTRVERRCEIEERMSARCSRHQGILRIP